MVIIGKTATVVKDTQTENGIGGHCVIPNTEMLADEFESKALDLILEYKK